MKEPVTKTTPDIKQEQIAKLYDLFPKVVTETEEGLRIECGKKHFTVELFPEVDYNVSTGNINAPSDFRDQVQRLIDAAE